MVGEQLWLDVDRLMQERPKREPKKRSPAPNRLTSGEQLEFPGDIPDVIIVGTTAPPEKIAGEAVIPSNRENETQRERFGTWLLMQVTMRGTLGDLAKAAKLDGQFPRCGSMEEVRARFSALGADGDAYEALEDAERAYERLAA